LGIRFTFKNSHTPKQMTVSEKASNYTDL